MKKVFLNKNPLNFAMLNTVFLNGGEGKVKKGQGGAIDDGYIRFKDPEVLRVLLANGVDTDGDGGITEEEAAAVTSIGTWFKNNTEITSFDELDKFTNVTTIAESGFNGCSKFKSISLMNIENIGALAFVNSALEGDIKIPRLQDNIRNAIFKGTNITSVSDLGEITSIINSSTSSMGAFNNCLLLERVILPETLTTIGPHSFRECPLLSYVYLPNSLTTLGASAFQNCTSLAIDDLSLPNLETLGQNAFYGVSIKKISNLGKITALPAATSSTQNFGRKDVLEEVVLPDTLEGIGAYSFYNYSSLSKINLEYVNTIGAHAFLNSGITELYAPNLTELLQPDVYSGIFFKAKLKHIRSLGNITYIPKGNSNSGCFKGCPLKTVTLPDTLKEIRDYAFADVTSVISMNLPESLEIINSLPKGSWADGIDISLPNLTQINSFAKLGIKGVFNLGSVTSLGVTSGDVEAQGVFRDCTNLELVKLPSTITSIGVSTFYKCTSLQAVVIEAVTPPALYNYAFNNSNDCPIYVPDASVTAYREASGWVDYADRIYPMSIYE